MHLETDLSKIRQIAAIRENENFRFRTFLKGKDDEEIDSIVHRLHKEITAQVDCTACRNCCYCLRSEVDTEDIQVLARLENISLESYVANYCEKEGRDFYFKDMPCRYINENQCRIYENRPKQCRTFPNTDKPGFIFRLWGMLRFYEICPIVFNLMEKLKDELRFYRRNH
ncbi:MAG: YkgJ family cysteine cluster protein [Prevotellaceae bacterium]|jgi:Fe-S-cluster containining protein|nr:YkgJ family cysteine cluster protein [Prevotellaceae bacterium]